MESFVIPGFELNMPLCGFHTGENDSFSSESNQQPGNSQQVRFIPPERCTAASAGPLPSFTPIHRRERGREREGRKEGGREGGGGWRAGPGPGEGEGRAAGGLLSRSGARALARRSRVLSLAPEHSPPAPPRSLDPRVAARSLPHSLSPPPDSAAVLHNGFNNRKEKKLRTTKILTHLFEIIQTK